MPTCRGRHHELLLVEMAERRRAGNLSPRRHQPSLIALARSPITQEATHSHVQEGGNPLNVGLAGRAHGHQCMRYGPTIAPMMATDHDISHLKTQDWPDLIH